MFNKIKALFKKDSVSNNNNNIVEQKFKDVDCLLSAYKRNPKLPIYLNASMKEIFNILCSSSDWRKEVDDFTLNELLKIYERWQKNVASLSSKDNEITQRASANGFKSQTIWEGTQEEYIAALKNGEIKKDMDIRIIEYTGVYTVMDENGEMMEEME